MAQRESLWIAGLKAVGGAVIATLAVRWLGVTVLTIPPEFLPLAGPGPTIFFTTVSGVAAVGVFALVRRLSSRPVSLFRKIAGVVLVLSFLPDLGLLSEGAADAFPGATPAGVSVLMLMHVVAAAVIVWVLTGAGDVESGGKE
ncbi:MAG: DUF6069 family protein [Gemmatimonadota bacterium]|nr:DUF6069 family protein [Gemmatimonadota bacterium]